jgi:aminotransferase
MKLTGSERSQIMTHSDIRAMTIECAKVNGINLAQGVCDLDIPPLVVAEAKKAIDDGWNTYTRYDGLPVLREAIAKKVKAFNGLEADVEKNIICSEGTTGAMFASCMALLNPGDEVIVPAPYYQYHVFTVQMCGGRPVTPKLGPPPAWKFDADAIQESITKKTKAIIINTPSNPSGKVYSLAELKALRDICVDHDLFCFTDEIYEYFVYDDLKHISPASLDGMAERTMTISGYSKSFSITGWRVGYVHCHEKWKNTIGYVNDLINVCTPTPFQIAVAKGIEQLPASYYSGICDEYAGKRKMMLDACKDAGLHAYKPEGSYYVLADVSMVPGKTAKDKAMHILKKTGVGAVPATAFFPDSSGDAMVRFCFAKRDPVLKEACDRLRKLHA